jgi:hypothetical protein
MKTFKAYLEQDMVAITVAEAIAKINNTDAADINEIMLGYYLAGGWNKFDSPSEAKSQIKAKTQKVGKEISDIQSVRAEVMSKKVI